MPEGSRPVPRLPAGSFAVIHNFLPVTRNDLEQTMTTEKQREQNRERQQRFRDRKKRSREESMHADTINDEGLAERVKSGKCFVGEVFPGVDADNLTDALRVAREMAHALGISDVQPGESLLEFERRTFDAWANRGAPFLIRATQSLVPGWGRGYFVEHCGGFDKCWIPLPGSDNQVDLSSLPPLSADS
jgi:hypothetical protein